MISFDGNEAPMWFIVIVLAIGVLCAAGTGFFSELTRRNSTLKDLQIIRLLREDPTNADALAVADAYEKKVIKRTDAHVHKRTAISLALGMLVRGTPVFVLAMVIWPFTVLYEIWQGGQPSLLYVVQSFASWFLAGLMAEGIFSVMRPFVTPLSERWDRITRGGKAGGKGDAGDVPSGKKDQ